MAELARERQIVKGALSDLAIDAWVFEANAGSRSESIQQAYRRELETSTCISDCSGMAMANTPSMSSSVPERSARAVCSEKRHDIDGRRDPMLHDQAGERVTRAALHGAGGVGKSVAAALFARDAK